mmetsp:Transcript_16127/g.34861  ORF Transcript_16127/g.34861 Transcript_16127/m.34861 type:complete len:88 (+) Transcript_16127:57-320(+)
MFVQWHVRNVGNIAKNLQRWPFESILLELHLLRYHLGKLAGVVTSYISSLCKYSRIPPNFNKYEHVYFPLKRSQHDIKRRGNSWVNL